MESGRVAEPAGPALRLRVLAPHGALASWFGEVLLGLDALGSVRLQLERLEEQAVNTSSAGSTMRAWEWRQRGLRPWVPAPAAQARLRCWEHAAASGDAADIIVSFDTHLHRQTGVGAPPSGRIWTLCDGAGEPIYRRFPLLRPITAGKGIRLHCLEREPAGAWRLRRTVHVPASARYSEGLATGVLSLQRLLQLAMVDLRNERATSDRGVSASSAFEPRDAIGESHVRAAWLGLCGRWRDWHRRQRQRWVSEYWRIGVIDAPIGQLTDPAVSLPVRWITRDNRGGYWADPFGLPGDPMRLACEFFNERTGVGQLEILQFGADDELVGRSRIRVSEGRHASFPTIFELEGRRFGLAETAANRHCMLHEVDDAGTWRALFPLLDGVAAVDPVLFRHGDLYWLAYTDADLGERENLCLSHADRIEGPWHPHAANPVKVDVTAARMAGSPFWHDGALYRPAQDCLQTYGAAVVLNRITTLTPTQFSEVGVRRLAPERRSPCPDGLHTVTAWGDRTLIDGKRHGLNPVTLRRKLIRTWRLTCGESDTAVPVKPKQGAAQ